MAKWSDIWKSDLNPFQKKLALQAARFTPSGGTTKKTGGKLSSSQPARFSKR